MELVYTRSASPYMDQYNETEKRMASARSDYIKRQEELRDAFRKQAAESRDSDIKKVDTQYDASGRQNYINYMQAQKQLPNQLNSLGIRGGASESSLIRLGNTYGTNVANNEAARGTAKGNILDTYTKSLNDYDNSYKSSMAEYDSDYQNRLASAYATAMQNQITYENEQKQKDLEYFSGVINGLYGDTASYDYLINQLYASDDPNKDYKIMLALNARNALATALGQQKATTKNNSKSSSKSSGGGSKSSGGSSKSSSSSKSSGSSSKSSSGSSNSTTYTITKNTGQPNQLTTNWLGNGAKGRAVR